MTTVEINKNNYKVEENEFVRLTTNETYCNTIIRKNVGYYERVLSLITELKKINDAIDVVVFVSPTHGGFLPLMCSKFFKKIYLYNSTGNHKKNIVENIKLHNKENMKFIYTLKNIKESKNNLIIFNENEDFNDNEFIGEYRPILISTKSKYLREQENYIKYQLTKTDIIINVPNNFQKSFYREFKYFFLENTNKKNDNIQFLNYDNLVNLCVIVKNGGEDFRKMLIENYHIFDRWTILDTGSTDNTIEIITELLIDKKKGNLYQEPFIDFGTTRNRCIELAGDDCKFFLMLDDTYIIKNRGREIIDFLRDDQFADSFSFYIKSNDIEYATNRLVKTDRKHLKYLFKIHEVITYKNNVNVILPKDDIYIYDFTSDYMQNRTIVRKQLDLKLLFEEIQDDPDNPRHYYYVAQTYNLLGNSELAFEYFLKRFYHSDPNEEGFIQEKYDAIFEASRIANFKLNKDWEECKKYYELAYETDNERPETQYFLGIHYFMKNTHNDRKIAFNYFKKAFEIGYPVNKQYSLKPTLSFYFVPKFLSELCYSFKDFVLGIKVCEYYFFNNKSPTDIHDLMFNWYKIFEKLIKLPKRQEQTKVNDALNKEISFQNNKNPILCFVADGGWGKWTGRDILTKGIGGSETYIIEMAKYIQKLGIFNVYVFCNCFESDNYENVTYLHLDQYFSFIQNNHIHSSIISRYLEYIPVTIEGNVDNIYVVFHDLLQNNPIIPLNNKIKKIFCLSEWHVSHINSIIPQIKELTVPLYYGIDKINFEIQNNSTIIPYKFIYSSFPNRGLLQLLQLWPLIINRYKTASLYIYCNIDGKWVNDIAPDTINEIKRLLHLFKDKQFNVNYCGWVDKKTLANSWQTSDIWFYPCTFTETFCLTALEAAISKTLVVTNDLGALKNTVGDRGIVIKGDAKTDEWKKKAINELFKVLEDKQTKNNLIEKNYEWGKKLSWEGQAKILQNYLTQQIQTIQKQPKLTNTNVNTNINENGNGNENGNENENVKLKNLPPFLKNNFPMKELNYANMLNWVHNLPKNSNDELNIFIKNLDHLNSKNIKNPKILEIGTFAGTSLIHIVNYIHNSYGVGIDCWKNYQEFFYDSQEKTENNLVNNIEKNGIQNIFHENIKKSNLSHRIEGRKGDSIDILTQMIINGETYDLIYVDASHISFDCYADMILAFKLLNKNGMLIVDDVSFNKPDETKNNIEPKQIINTPYYSILHFYEKYKNQIKILNSSYRLFLEKI